MPRRLGGFGRSSRALWAGRRGECFGGFRQKASRHARGDAGPAGPHADRCAVLRFVGGSQGGCEGFDGVVQAVDLHLGLLNTSITADDNTLFQDGTVKTDRRCLVCTTFFSGGGTETRHQERQEMFDGISRMNPGAPGRRRGMKKKNTETKQKTTERGGGLHGLED